MIIQHDLNNGAKILMEKVENTEVVSIGFWFLHGSRDETPNHKGYSHFLEHMLFKGTDKRSAFQIVQEIDRVGGMLNAFTEKEQTCFYCTLAAEHAGLALDVLTDMVFSSILPENEIEREKIVVINEIKETLDNPEELAYEYFVRSLWDGHPIADKITGEIENIESITKEKLSEFYRNWYVPRNLLISVAGKFDLESVTKTIEATLPEMKTEFRRVPRRAPQTTSNDSYISGGFKQVQIFSGVSFDTPKKIEEFYHLLVFSTMFGESMSSRLFQHIRENRGFCYSIFSLRSFFTHTSMWAIYANTSPPLLNNLVDALNLEFHNITNDSLRQEEIDDAISHLVGGTKLSQEDMEIRMKRLVRHFLLGNEIHDINDSIRFLNETSIDDINIFLNKYILNKTCSTLVFGTRNLHKRKKRTIQFH